jgi:hypothetical protein
MLQILGYEDSTELCAPKGPPSMEVQCVQPDKCCLYVSSAYVRGCIQKFPDWVDNEINNNNNNNKHSLRSNTKGYGGETH